MSLYDAIRSAGMTPPAHIRAGRFERFPGIGKARGDSGWCKLISDKVGIFGDWSTGLSQVWHESGDAIDLAIARDEIRKHQMQAEKQQQEAYAKAARQAQELVRKANTGPHQYLADKGFPEQVGLILDGDLLIPMRDATDCKRLHSIQRIKIDGSKKFLPGGKTKGAVFVLGDLRGSDVYFVEGYATGLSVALAAKNLFRRYRVIVCFSAHNLIHVAKLIPGGIVMADNDESKTGEKAAIATGKPWVMPATVGEDWNDVHQRDGIGIVERAIRAPP